MKYIKNTIMPISLSQKSHASLKSQFRQFSIRFIIQILVQIIFGNDSVFSSEANKT